MDKFCLEALVMHEDMPINPLCIIAALGGVVHISTSKKYYLRNVVERFKSVY